MNNKKTTIGITGGIGSGKSHVSSLMQRELGIPVYDCDKEAKRLIATDEEIRCKLTELVGQEVFKDGKLNKKLLADFLLADAENASQVNAIVHPAVLKDFMLWAEKQETKVVALESAILFESGFVRYVDVAVCVTAPLSTRIARVMHRDGISREQTLEWMSRQWPQEEVARRADFIIVNDGWQDVDEQITRVLMALEKWNR